MLAELALVYISYGSGLIGELRANGQGCHLCKIRGDMACEAVEAITSHHNNYKKGEYMEQYTEQEYKAKFGEQAWQDKVLAGNDGYSIESVWATGIGNIFMVITKDEM